MKKIILLSLLVFSQCIEAQFSFDFEDAGTTGWVFSQPGRWLADDTEPLSGFYSLHHVYDNSVASSDAAMFSIAGLCPSCGMVTWEFVIRHGADPSSSNRWSYLLMSDAGPEDISSGRSVNGYAAGVNLSGYDDTLRLWHLSGGRAEAVLSTDINWQSDIGTDSCAVIRVTREVNGEWELSVAWSIRQGADQLEHPSADGQAGPWGEWRGSWSGFGETLHPLRYAGLLYVYTATRDMLLWIDDVSVDGIFIPDTTAPAIKYVVALEPDLLQVVLDEDPDYSFSDSGNIFLLGGPDITGITRVAASVYHLRLAENIANRVAVTLTAGRICDELGNCRADVSFSFTPAYAVTGDIVISEIMADPSPPVSLPEREYLEITNRSGDSLYCGDDLLIAGNDTCFLAREWIRSGESIILCSSAAESQLSRYGRTMTLPGFPTINDGGEVLALRSNHGSLLHAVSYAPDFLGDGPRSGGGWSAELADMGNPFNEPEAWYPSLDPSGGTPGRSNSVQIMTIDSRCPRAIAVWPLVYDTLCVMFDETVVEPEGTAWLADGGETFPALPADPSDRLMLVPLHEKLKPGAVTCLQVPSSVTDFAGNEVCDAFLGTGIPSDPMPGDILFNELLFDPFPGCEDYIEFFNNSSKVINLSSLLLACSINSAATAFTEVPGQLLPGDFVAVTTDRDAVLRMYPCADPGAVFQADRLPSMPDDRGTLVLYDHNLNIIDKVDYSRTMHLLFLSGVEGVALEKASPEFPSDITGNWHSASETCGWGTPGAPNSVSVYLPENPEGLTLSSGRVSPDGDGFEDLLSVSVYPGGSDNVISVTVFSDRGYIVRRLAERVVAGPGASFIWDGTSDGGGRLPAGLYMIMAESINAAGESQRWKKVCALLYR